MSSTFATLNDHAQPAKPHNWRKLVFIIAICIVIAGGGWWAYQHDLISQTPRQAGQPAAVSSTTTTNIGTITAPGTTLPSVQENSAGATEAGDGAEPAAVNLAAVAGVNGTTLWSDHGELVATLDSGSLITIRARTANSAWLAVESDAGPGWVMASTVIGYGFQRLATELLPGPIAQAALGTASLEPATSVAASAGYVATASSASAASASAASASAASASAADAQSSRVQLPATVTTAGSQLNIRSGPGPAYPILDKADDGAAYTAIARSADGDWLLLQLSTDATHTGWVSASYIQLGGDLQTLPVSDAAASTGTAA